MKWLKKAWKDRKKAFQWLGTYANTGRSLNMWSYGRSSFQFKRLSLYLHLYIISQAWWILNLSEKLFKLQLLMYKCHKRLPINGFSTVFRETEVLLYTNFLYYIFIIRLPNYCGLNVPLNHTFTGGRQLLTGIKLS